MNVDLANLASPPRESERVTELIGMKGFDSRWLDIFIRFVCLFVCLHEAQERVHRILMIVASSL